MGRAIGSKLGKLIEGDRKMIERRKDGRKKKSENGGNRRERKLKKELKNYVRS